MIHKARYVLSGHWAHLSLAVVIGVSVNAIFAVVDPLIFKYLIDEGLTSGDFRLFAILATAIVIFGVFIRIGFWVFELITQSLKNKVVHSLTLKMLRGYYRIPYAEISKTDRGYFLSRIYEEPNKIAQGLVSTVIGFIIQLTTFLAAAAVALYLDWKITLLLSVIVPSLSFLAKRFSPQISATSKQENEDEAQLRNHLGSAIGAYTTVRIFSLQNSATRIIRSNLDRFLGTLFFRIKTSVTYKTAANIIMSLAEAAVLIAAGYQVVTGELTIGGLFGFMNAFWKVINAANGIIALVPQFANLRGYIERLIEFETLFSEVEDSSEQDTESETPRHILIKDLTFEYGDGTDQKIFEDFELKIDPAQRVLLLGPNGSGKSTLAYLIADFLKPTKGEIVAPNLGEISAQLSSSNFIPGTLKDNVDYDNLNEEKKEFFWRLCEDFKLDDKAERNISSALSQGERKKAQILMALLKDAEVYIFDEPLANIDTASKENILKHQMERTRGKILISILHGDEHLYADFDKVVRLQLHPSRAGLEPRDDAPIGPEPPE